MAPVHGMMEVKDEEQNRKLKEIVELLVASGYFRARIKGLSPFDKVVGGLVWCISVCSYDIDVDLFFQENATIGQKISLTEKIVEVLKEMKCPHLLVPHQIQGLDFTHIFVVIQWLVKKAIESKKGREDYNRAFAISEFNKIHTLALGDPLSKKYGTIPKLDELKFQPQRKYKRVSNTPLLEESLQVQSTLLEYGKKHQFADTSSANKPNSSDELKHSEEPNVDKLLSGLSSANQKEDIVPPELVGHIVKQQAEEISKIMSDYDNKAKRLKEMGLERQASSAKSLAVLNKQIDFLDGNLSSLVQQRETLTEDLSKAQAQLKTLLDESALLTHQLEDRDEKSQKDGSLLELERLAALNDDLKKREAEFRANCMAEKKKLDDLVQQLSSQESQEKLEEKQKIQGELDESLETLRRIRLVLGKKNREISALERKIDDVPTREELHQYQCRFIELHNQVSSKHKETKQFYTFHNTLDDTRLYLDKEVGLLNSILDNFERAMSSESQKATFMKQFEQIVEGVKQNKLKVERKKQEVKSNKAQLQDDLMEVVEKQRLYFKTVKDFQEECRKNETILMKLQQLGRHPS